MTIRKKGNVYCVYSESGRKMGEYRTMAEAEARLRQLEAFKHMRKRRK